jgi:hypothetical protein
LISNKDFSGINKKLTNWFIEWLKTLITKKT